MTSDESSNEGGRYDRECSTYWCNQCGGEMTVKFSMSNDYGIILECPDCGGRLYFASVSQDTFWRVTDG